MALFLKFVKCILLALLVITLFSDEAEARRKILKGRKTITRSYYKNDKTFGLKRCFLREQPLLPPWANVLLAGVGFLVVGVVLYIAMAKFILGSTTGIFMMNDEV